MKTTLKTVLTLLLGFGLVLGYDPITGAQESDIDEFTLEEITVTAQKREENQQKVALTMEIYTAEELTEFGKRDLDDILFSSGIIINRAEDGLRVSIRGVADEATPHGELSFNVETASVALNKDGVYSQRRSTGSGLYDMERVEVLYGPQATLYASNSPGGIVNIVTADPKLENFEVSALVEVGNYDKLQTQAVLNAPITDKTALRIATSLNTRSGYMANGQDDDDTKSARLKYLIKPNEKFSVVMTGEWTKTQNIGYKAISFFNTQDELGDPWDNSETGEDEPTKRTYEFEWAYGHINLDVGVGDLTIVPSHTSFDAYGTQYGEDFMTGADVISDYVQEGYENSVEGRLTSYADSPVTWILGVNYYRRLQCDWVDSDNDTASFRENRQSVKAIFGNITYPMSEKFRVTGGLRYSEDNTYSTRNMLISGVARMDNKGWGSYSGPDYKIGVEYDLSPDTMLYTSIATSYRTPPTSFTTLLEPEKLTSYTIGSKSRFFGNKLQVNWDAFYYDYKDFRVDANVIDPILDNKDARSATNADLEKYGMEINTNAMISTNDQLSLSVSYLHSRFAKLVFDFASEALEDMTLTGQKETYAPEWSVKLGYQHNFILANEGVLTAGLESVWKSEYLLRYNDKYQTRIPGGGVDWAYYGDYKSQEAHHISNASLQYADPKGRWTLSGYVQNLENYAVKRFLMGFGLTISAPRTYGAVLTIKLSQPK